MFVKALLRSSKKMSWETLVRMKGNAREIFGVSLALQLEDVGIMLATMTASTEFAT